jgi:hypothetical protein
MRWRQAWSRVDLDFHQFHIYDWMDQDYPYSSSPSSFGVDDKPVVMGEFDPSGLRAASYATVVSSWYNNGYAGALAWQDGQMCIDWSAVKAFADQHPCETQY